ncbi:sugar transferase [Cyanobium sp. Morenito 9A2]|uniref:sugar transferase n=1 Tax=Cyanobium sp. Morenito 9A2 TaxID=2823718 RepID=UPI0020CB8DAC|nr:sugar transferase [Cyanobium sp. Morenito 9A2]MCP9849453.1 sugar transferase [Cyanobium sp. Morenito 9A2]
MAHRHDPGAAQATPTSGVTVTSYRGTLLLGFPRRFTVTEAVAFRDALAELLPQHPDTRRIVLDFSRTELIDSSGLGSLISNLKEARARAIPMVAWSAGAQVKLAFSLMGLEPMLPLAEGSEALNPALALTSKERPAITHPSVRSLPKRLIDIVGALVGLAVTALLFPFIALAIRQESKGPILFAQVRMGWMGRRFRLWKFRSMVVNAEALRQSVKNEASGAFFKNANDPRITRVGKFLRRTSLDELPQFWNVLIGDMSLVGTRPPTPDEVDRYAVPNWQRLDVRPGLSGEWQVNGRSQVLDFEDVIKLDLRYQENWSLRHDLHLMVKTLTVIFSKRSGAS